MFPVDANSIDIWIRHLSDSQHLEQNGVEARQRWWRREGKLEPAQQHAGVRKAVRKQGQEAFRRSEFALTLTVQFPPSGMGLQTDPAMEKSLDSRPTVEDFRDDNAWVKLAKTHWLETAKVRKVKQDVIKKDLWDALEAERFNLRSLLILENLNILEKYAPRLYDGLTLRS